MTENNEVIKALGQVPELVEKTKRVLEDSDKKFRILAEATQKRMQAEIPSSEIEKISNIVAATVSRTKCARPDTDEVSRLVAGNIMTTLTESVMAMTIDAVKAAVADTPIKVEHNHTHTTLTYMCQMAEKTLRNWILGLAIYSIVLSFVGILIGVSYLNSDKYLGAKYAEIYFSKYTTDAERKMLDANTYMVGFLPREFDKTPKLVKQKIKRNQQILSQREMEAKAKKGKYSTIVPLER